MYIIKADLQTYLIEHNGQYDVEARHFDVSKFYISKLQYIINSSHEDLSMYHKFNVSKSTLGQNASVTKYSSVIWRFIRILKERHMMTDMMPLIDWFHATSVPKRSLRACARVDHVWEILISINVTLNFLPQAAHLRCLPLTIVAAYFLVHNFTTSFLIQLPPSFLSTFSSSFAALPLMTANDHPSHLSAPSPSPAPSFCHPDLLFFIY